MKTLNNNYKKNIEILKENIKRGMDLKKVKAIIDGQEQRFIEANLYNKDEKDYINEMRKVLVENFTNIKINIIK